MRFFAPLREVSNELLDKLIHYDPARAMAFIAVDDQSQRMLGVVRLHDDTGGENAEFAILVRSRLKGHGVGWLLIKHMSEFSRHKDLKTVRGQVLAENATMLAMCAHCRRSGRSQRQDGDTASASRSPHPAMTLNSADTIRRSSDWNLGIRAGLKQGRKRLFNRHGS